MSVSYTLIITALIYISVSCTVTAYKGDLTQAAYNIIYNKSKKRLGGFEYNSDDIACGIFIAPSSLPGAGLGIFAGKQYKKGDMILKADGPSIPIVDPDFSQKSMETWLNLFSDYVWDDGISDPALYESNYTLEFSSAAMPNSHPILNNMDISHPAVIPYDETLDRDKSPGAGGISNYMGRNIISTKDIDEGKEIFLQYPDSYMDSLSLKYNLPKRKNYFEAGMIVMTLMGKNGTSYVDWQKSELYSLASNKTFSLLPSSQSDVDKITSFLKDRRDVETFVLSIAETISVRQRSLDWLINHGVCLDNIVPSSSTNPRAGKGAIAKRQIPKGTGVVAAPVLQITNRDALRIPAFDGDRWQLLLNYCLGNNNSSLLLCPYTNSILVNHCSDRKPEMHPCGLKGQTPNAKYRWASWDHTTERWLTKTISDIEKSQGRGLTLEIFATRDISKGEEVFIDYGLSWEEAWDRHISQWKPSQQYQTHDQWTSLGDLNRSLKPLILAPNLDEKHISTDSRGLLFTCCYYYEDRDYFWQSLREEKTNEKIKISYEPWNQMPLQEILDRYGKDYPADKFKVDENGTYSDGDFWPCVVIKKNVEEDRYVVRIVQSSYHDDTIWEEMKLPRIILNYPRSSIRHLYLPYKSDIWLPGAFRHPIGIPDNLLPPQWKDL